MVQHNTCGASGLLSVYTRFHLFSTPITSVNGR